MGGLDNEACEELRNKITQRLSEKWSLPLDRRRSRCSTDTHNKRVVIALSQRYCDKSYQYWFCYSLQQRDFLRQATDGYLALGVLDSGKMFLIPLDVVDGFVKHVYFCKIPKRYDIVVKTIGRSHVVRLMNHSDGFNLTPYEL